MHTGQRLGRPFFFLPPSPACLPLALRVVVFSFGILSVLRDRLASSTRQVRVMRANEGNEGSGWMMWMMWMKSRPDPGTITIANADYALLQCMGLGKLTYVPEVVRVDCDGSGGPVFGYKG